ncbi:putative PHD type zinc finger protein with BAH domain-containing protein [Boothiomyces sp. JEL0866]|nr:putative PHD type zinc finger protein with BAH domain-containing protein [Boothiomyces sp. JEL0866]
MTSFIRKGIEYKIDGKFTSNYYIGRIMAIDLVRSVVRVAWFTRQHEISTRTKPRVVFATMSSDYNPIAAIKGKLTIMHIDHIKDLEKYKKQDDCFYFSQHIPNGDTINYKYLLVEHGKGKTFLFKRICLSCDSWCNIGESVVQCEVCSDTYHTDCVGLERKRPKVYSWQCATCSSKPNGSNVKKLRKTVSADAINIDLEKLGENNTQELPEFPFYYFGEYSNAADLLTNDVMRGYPKAQSRLGKEHQAEVPAYDESHREAPVDEGTVDRYNTNECIFSLPEDFRLDEYLEECRIILEIEKLDSAAIESLTQCLHRYDYNKDAAVKYVKSHTQSFSCLPPWSLADRAAMDAGIAKFSQDLYWIQKEFLSHKTLKEVILYYYMFKEEYNEKNKQSDDSEKENSPVLKEMDIDTSDEEATHDSDDEELECTNCFTKNPENFRKPLPFGAIMHCDSCRKYWLKYGTKKPLSDHERRPSREACYGVSHKDVEDGVQYRCDVCVFKAKTDSQLIPQCVLCTLELDPKFSPLKKTIGTDWAHSQCAIWIPQIKFGNPKTLEYIECIGLIDQVCSICKQRGGATIKCSERACNSYFHVTCSQMKLSTNHLYVRIIKNKVEVGGYCSQHSRRGKNVHVPEIEIKDSWEKEMKTGSEASVESGDFLLQSFNYPFVSIGVRGNHLACATAYQFSIYLKNNDRYELTGEGIAAEKETITCILSSALYMPNNKENLIYCLITGYSNGNFKVFNEKGEVVISQSFRQSAITSIAFKPMLGESDIEELIIYYHELFTFDPVPLIFKKYLLYGQETIMNVVSVGPTVESNIFDLDYDIVSGKVINQPNITARFVGIGYPFVGMYVCTETSPKYTLTGLVANKSSEVSTAVLSYAKSLLNMGATETSQTTNFKPTQLNSQVIIEDGNRSAVRISVDPSYRYCAISDNLGRVLLLDISDSSIVHIWKGIRDAQLGWIQVAHDNDPTIVSNLLAIYGNTGILELHSVPIDSRVAALNVGKGMKLIQTPYSMIGGMHWRGEGDRFNAQCFLLSPTGDIKSIAVTAELKHPNVFKTLKILIASIAEQDADQTTLDIVQYLEDLQLKKSKLKALELFSDSFPLHSFQTILNKLSNNFVVYSPSFNLDGLALEDVEFLKYQHFLKVYQNIESSSKDGGAYPDWISELPETDPKSSDTSVLFGCFDIKWKLQDTSAHLDTEYFTIAVETPKQVKDEFARFLLGKFSPSSISMLIDEMHVDTFQIVELAIQYLTESVGCDNIQTKIRNNFLLLLRCYLSNNSQGKETASVEYLVANYIKLSDIEEIEEFWK